jgi:GT2 family glycosyltransferase
MKLSIVILNWNGSRFLQKFLPSVIRYSFYDWVEIVVADNGSSDNSKEVVEKEFPSVRYLQLEKNYGFAEGYNKALQQIDADYYLLLNSDVEVTEDWLEPLLDTMESDNKISACQPKIISLNDQNRFEYAGASGGFIDRFGYPFCRGRILNVMEPDEGQYNTPISVFWASGAAMLVRADVWKKLEGFDADFYAHMEEIDLCWRMKNIGYQVAVCPQSTVYHLGGGSLSYGNPIKIYLNFRNNLFLLYKNLPKDKLLPVLLARMILDGIAAFQFLVTGQFKAFKKVFAAHNSFHSNFFKLIAKRKKLLQKTQPVMHPEIYKGSIVWDFFIRKKRKFSELKFKTKSIGDN